MSVTPNEKTPSVKNGALRRGGHLGGFAHAVTSEASGTAWSSGDLGLWLAYAQEPAGHMQSCLFGTGDILWREDCLLSALLLKPLSHSSRGLTPPPLPHPPSPTPTKADLPVCLEWFWPPCALASLLMV